MSKFAINIKEDGNEIRRVLSILFSKGYVFHHPERANNMEKFERMFGNYWKYWNYIVIGSDVNCKMILNAHICLNTRFKLITIEDFLKLNE